MATSFRRNVSVHSQPAIPEGTDHADFSNQIDPHAEISQYLPTEVAQEVQASYTQIRTEGTWQRVLAAFECFNTDEEMEQDRGGVLGDLGSIEVPRDPGGDISVVMQPTFTSWDMRGEFQQTCPDVYIDPMIRFDRTEVDDNVNETSILGRAQTPSTPVDFNTLDNDEVVSDDDIPIAQSQNNKRKAASVAEVGAAASTPKKQRTHASPVDQAQRIPARNSMIEESDDEDYHEPQLLDSAAFIALFGPRVEPSPPRSALTGREYSGKSKAALLNATSVARFCDGRWIEKAAAKSRGFAVLEGASPVLYRCGGSHHHDLQSQSQSVSAQAGARSEGGGRRGKTLRLFNVEQLRRIAN